MTEEKSRAPWDIDETAEQTIDLADPPAEKGSYPRESRRVERTLLLRFKLCTRHHVANRGRVPLPAARRVDPARAQGIGDLPQ
jgi:hypothetical protein